jgi:peptidyl-dipeptidase Dcp
MLRLLLTIFTCAAAGWALVSCTESVLPEPNPLLGEFDTPFGVPPFGEIEEKHYLPAFQEGIRQHREEIQLIVADTSLPTFENTIEALEESGALSRKVSWVFFNMTSALTNDELQKIAKEVAPLLSKHRDDILLDPALFERIQAVNQEKDQLGLSAEQLTLLENQYRDFVRGGASLSEEAKAELRKINEQLSVLSVQFGENVLKENNAFELVITEEEDLAGLPEASIIAAAEAASERDHGGKWVFTLHKPSMIPFLQYSEKRELREKIFKAYINRGDNGNELDNNEIVTSIADLRSKRANLLGYETHADYVLELNMAKNPDGVLGLLDQLWKPALAMARKEAEDLQAMINREGGNFELEAWDWFYYAEKLRKEKYDLDEESLRPYFMLENVRDGAFGVAERLYGISFEEKTDLPKYHEDVQVFEVKERDGSHIGILYLDYFPRASKRGGAWMNSYRKQHREGGRKIAPVICNVCNFSKPTGDKPALLSTEEVGTLFHEFGHALHGLLSDCTYASLSGTSVPRDFVELPSQIMENWAFEPEVLNSYARHFETDEVIPKELVDKIIEARKFNQGFAMVEYLAASYLDMDWHSLNETADLDVAVFEAEAMSRIGLIPEIVVRYRSPYFSHIFSGGYSAGYYSYIWAEVLDADAFQAFKETSLFDQDTASAFRKNILQTGGTEPPEALYQRFRGAPPSIEALLERKGISASG